MRRWYQNKTLFIETFKSVNILSRRNVVLTRALREHVPPPKPMRYGYLQSGFGSRLLPKFGTSLCKDTAMIKFSRGSGQFFWRCEPNYEKLLCLTIWRTLQKFLYPDQEADDDLQNLISFSLSTGEIFMNRKHIKTVAEDILFRAALVCRAR